MPHLRGCNHPVFNGPERVYNQFSVHKTNFLSVWSRQEISQVDVPA